MGATNTQKDENLQLLILQSLKIPYHQLPDPFFSLSFLRLHPTQLGIDAVTLLESYLMDKRKRTQIFQDLQLGNPDDFIVRPTTHSHEKNDLELIYSEPKESHVPNNDFGSIARAETNSRGITTWHVEFTIKTNATGKVQVTLESLLRDMIKRKSEDHPVNGLLIFFAGGYPPNIPDTEKTMKTKFFMVLVAIPSTVVNLIEELPHSQDLTSLESKAAVLRSIRTRIDEILEEKSHSEQLEFITTINPERALTYFTVNRVAALSITHDEVMKTLGTLENRIDNLENAVGKLASTVNKMEREISETNKKIDQILQYLKETKKD